MYGIVLLDDEFIFINGFRETDDTFYLDVVFTSFRLKRVSLVEKMKKEGSKAEKFLKFFDDLANTLTIKFE